MCCKYIAVFFSVILCIVFLPAYGQKDFAFQHFIGPKIPLQSFRGIISDSQGNFLILDSDDNSIHKIDLSGKYITKFRLPKREDNANQNPISITIDKNDNIYVGNWNGGEIIKMDNVGKIIARFLSTVSGNGMYKGPEDIKIDNRGNIYIVDTYTNRVQKLDSNGKFIMKFGTYGSGNGQLNAPGDIAIDNSYNIYVGDGRNARIQKFDSSGNFLFSFGSQGSQDGQFYYGPGITLDKQGNIYAADPLNKRIQKFDPTGKFLWKSGTPDTDNGILMFPNDIAIDPSGNICVQDLELFGLVKLTPQGKLISQVKFDKENRLFTYPSGIARDLGDNIYVTDQKGIHKFDAQGNFLLKFTTQGILSDVPESITIDKWNNVYVIDRLGKLVKFDINGKVISAFDGTFGSPFSQSVTTDNQGNLYALSNNRFVIYDLKGRYLKDINLPAVNNGYFRSMAVDKLGSLYITYSTNTGIVINKCSSTGRLMRTFNIKDESGYPYGYNTYAVKIGIITDENNNVYLTDYYNKAIHKIDAITGNIISFGKYGSNEQEFDDPFAVTINSKGFLYVVDSGNDRISVFSTIGSAKTNFISGTIFSDLNQNCKQDTNEPGLSDVLVEAQPGSILTMTDATGHYSMQVDTGTYTVTQQFANHDKTILMKPICPADGKYHSVQVKEGMSVDGIDFADQATSLPYLSVHVASNRRRRCFTNTTTITYSNSGYADAQNVKVSVKLPQYVILKSSNVDYTIDKDKNYVFTIGTLKAKETGAIQITDSIACVVEARGMTACTQAWITPANSYTLPENSPWDQSDILLTGKCIENGRVQMVIKNTGKTMADSAEFRILLNAQLSFRKNYKLAIGDSLVLRIPANGKTVRLEADQRPGHPRKSQTNLTIEGCVASVSDVISKGYVAVLPQDDAEPEVASECLQIVDSYDPNDKLVSPAGTPSDNYTPSASELKYVIRFQNTGTDTAYAVTVIDTLSEHLDITTLQMGAYSHRYTLKVSGKGRPVLTWIFAGINLPDSTRDQAGSNGFIQFTIKPKVYLPEKVRIENFADIIFDYNEPVRTNTTVNVIYDVPPVIDKQNQLNEKTIVQQKPTISSFTPEGAKLSGQITLTGNHYQTVPTDNIVKVNEIPVVVISASETQLVVALPSKVTTGRISVTTPAGTAVSATDLVVFQPPVITGINPAKAHRGDQIILTGIHFESVAEYNLVKINDIPMQVLTATATQLTVVTPENATDGKVSLTTRGGSVISPSELVILFKPVITAFAPEEAQVGEQILVTGMNFNPISNQNTVKINGMVVSIVSAAETQLVITVPTGVTIGKVSVATEGGTAISEKDFVPLLPVITSFYPATGFVGTQVIISGKYYQSTASDNRVVIYGKEADIISASETELVIRIPEGAATDKIQVTTPTGSVISSTNFVVRDNAEWDDVIVIFPNPTDGKVAIDLSQSMAQMQQIEIFNNIGKRILSEKVTAITSKYEVDLSGNATGLYLILVKTDKGTVTRKIILK
ncbi:DUF7619 domain-containing protein [Xanthocytophaga agilis]|uniref:IPT/TIG domain-containing protein n=1 Tax=Xanthocytophaga agilis TaxID=3048010 RepID=A0AAE3UG52_9BACT|nr:IPT/TIG domain-containing protein [Xanthocytophaga agilis]MDJ1501273.1 IPT/TIG domain-containing protein [Xanthocytophaga agilis]